MSLMQTIASLEPGLYFGGGKEVMGEGELQSCLRVLATTEVEVYHCHIHTFFKFATPDMVRCSVGCAPSRLACRCAAS